VYLQYTFSWNIYLNYDSFSCSLYFDDINLNFDSFPQISSLLIPHILFAMVITVYSFDGKMF
jgi:hypothetical protein